METRRRGMPRIRSASIPLFGFDETRISSPRSDTEQPRGLGVASQGAEAAGQPLSQTERCGVAAEPSCDEVAQAAMNADALFAVGADADVSLEISLLPLSHA